MQGRLRKRKGRNLSQVPEVYVFVKQFGTQAKNLTEKLLCQHFLKLKTEIARKRSVLFAPEMQEWLRKGKTINLSQTPEVYVSVKNILVLSLKIRPKNYLCQNFFKLKTEIARKRSVFAPEMQEWLKKGKTINLSQITEVYVSVKYFGTRPKKSA